MSKDRRHRGVQPAVKAGVLVVLVFVLRVVLVVLLTGMMWVGSRQNRRGAGCRCHCLAGCRR